MAEPKTSLSVDLITSKKDRIRLELWAKESENSEIVERFIASIKILIASDSSKCTIDYVSGNFDYMLLNGDLRINSKLDDYFDDHVKTKENERLSNAFKNKPNYLVYSYPISTHLNSNYCYIISTSASSSDLKRKFEISKLNLLGKVTGDAKFKLLEIAQQQQKEHKDAHTVRTQHGEIKIRNPLEISDIQVIEHDLASEYFGNIDKFVAEKVPMKVKDDTSKKSKFKKRKQITLNFDEPEDEEAEETELQVSFKGTKDVGNKKFKMKSAFDLLPLPKKKETDVSKPVEAMKNVDKKEEPIISNVNDAKPEEKIDLEKKEEELNEVKETSKQGITANNDTTESEAQILQSLNNFSQKLSQLPERSTPSISNDAISKAPELVEGEGEEGIDGLSEEEDDLDFLNHKLVSNES